MDKQLSNKTGLIRFLAYLTTWQISCPQSPSSENLMWKLSYRLGFLPDAVKGKGKARNFFGKQFHPWPFVCDCFASRTLHSSQEGQCFPEREGYVLSEQLDMQRSSTVICLFPCLWLQSDSNSTHLTECNTRLKANAGLADVVFSIENVMDEMGLRNNHYMMTLNRKDLEEKRDFRDRDR